MGRFLLGLLQVQSNSLGLNPQLGIGSQLGLELLLAVFKLCLLLLKVCLCILHSLLELLELRLFLLNGVLWNVIKIFGLHGITFLLLCAIQVLLGSVGIPRCLIILLLGAVDIAALFVSVLAGIPCIRRFLCHLLAEVVVLKLGFPRTLVGVLIFDVIPVKLVLALEGWVWLIWDYVK